MLQDPSIRSSNLARPDYGQREPRADHGEQYGRIAHGAADFHERCWEGECASGPASKAGRGRP